jgi:hypothetical protein
MNNKTAGLFLCCLALVAWAGQGGAVEYFVNKQGGDDRDGLSRTNAFLTVQKGVNALQPGDILTIGPGEYRECVRRDKLGNAEKDTLIRADISGTAILRGDVPAPAFRKTDGFNFVYEADFERDVQAVNEVDTPAVLEVMPTVPELEFNPGSCSYDKGNKKLYISTSDLQAPDRHYYTVSVTNMHGVCLVDPVRVIIDGLAAGGFNSAMPLPRKAHGFQTAWGILTFNPKLCVIRNSVCFLNGGGIGLHTRDGGSNLIEKCAAYANGSRHDSSGGNILCYEPNHDEIRGCISFLSKTQGIRFYAGGKGPGVMSHNLAWGNGYGDIWIKGTGFEESGLSRGSNCVTLGDCNILNISNSIVGEGNSYRRPSNPMSPDNIRLSREPVNKDREFADPVNFDFRLQGTSRFRNSGPNGSDRGAYPYEANIFYVKPSGDDQFDGLSVSNAWKTLQRALKNLRPGDTLYLEGGTYAADVELTAGKAGGKAINIRGRGTAPVVVNGLLKIAKSLDIAFERLDFAGTISVTASRNISFHNCRFSASSAAIQAAGADGLRITHGLFTGFKTAALELAACSNIFLGGNIFDNRLGPALRLDSADALLYTDGNAYRDPALAWQVNGSTWPLLEAQKLHENFSKTIVPDIAIENGVIRLNNRHEFAGRGPAGSSIGIDRPFQIKELRTVPPRVHSVSANTANLEWWTSLPAVCELGWGDTPTCSNKVNYDVNCYGTYSLAGLMPGRKYYFTIKALQAMRDVDITWSTNRVSPREEPIEFTTLASNAAPRSYYVAPDGSDANTGQSRSSAWRTIQHAAGRVNAGDTVLVASNNYMETVRVRASGESNAPITFKAMPGERVTMDGFQRALGCSFIITAKSHLNFDGFYLVQLNGADVNSHRWKNTAFRVYGSDNVRISRCFHDGRGGGYSPGILIAWNSENLHMKNSVIMNGFSGLSAGNCPEIRIENCLFVRNLIPACSLSAPKGSKVYFNGNIICDNLPTKVGVALVNIGRADDFVEKNNCYFLRVPDEQRKPLSFGDYHGTNTRLSVSVYCQGGKVSDSIVADPQFAALITTNAPALTNVVFPVDRLMGLKLDFPPLFATNPELVRRGIGLVPEDFKDFNFK